MKSLKMLGLAAVAAVALAASAAPAASATTLEVGGEAQNEAVALEMSLKAGTSTIWTRTDGSLAGTCTASTAEGTTNVFTGETVTAPLSSLSFSSCERPVTVHKAGTLHIEHIAGTTDGTVSSSGAEWTVGSIFGTLNCKTGAGVDIGTLTGKKEGNAVIDINAVLNCGFLVPSAKWTGTYEITSPEGLGVTDQPPPLPTTTLEVGGTPKGEKVEITASLASGSSSLLARTDGSFANTCTESHVNGSSESPYTGEAVTGPISSLSFTGCTRPVTVHKAGNLYVEHVPGTTDGTVSSEESEVTVGSPFGTLNCRTTEGTHLGTLTGQKEGTATIDVNAVLNCGLLVPSAKWTGTYEITSPEGLGVTT